MSRTDQSYKLAKQRYAELGVDVDAALATLATILISLHGQILSVDGGLHEAFLR